MAPSQDAENNAAAAFSKGNDADLEVTCQIGEDTGINVILCRDSS